MSRSRRKTPIFRHGGDSQKQDKRFANRLFRRINKQKTHRAKQYFCIPELYIIDAVCEFTQLREVSNVWDWSGDGKSWNGDYVNTLTGRDWHKYMGK